MSTPSPPQKEIWEVKYVAPMGGYMLHRERPIAIPDGWEPFAV